MQHAEPVTSPDAGRLAWTDRWLGWRDRLLTSPAFHRWASSFPLTRGIARRRAAALFDLVAGFVYTQVLTACVRLQVFEQLKDGPLSVAELARRWSMPEDAALTLLRAAASLRLLQRRRDGRYGLGPVGAPMVGNAAVVAMVEHHGALYRDLADPVALLRGGAVTDATRTGESAGLAGYWPYASAERPAELDDARVAAYCALMSASQPLVAGEVLDAHDFSQHRAVLDVGGGEGRFLCAVGERHPAVRLMLFDLPAVARRAERRLAAAGLGARASVHGGSFLTDALPGGADLVTLVRVVHDHDDARALGLLRKVRAALPAGGHLLVAEPMAGTAGAEPMGDAYFGLYLLAMGRGRPRTEDELRGLLAAAGFERVRALPTRMPLQTRLLHARAAS